MQIDWRLKGALLSMVVAGALMLFLSRLPAASCSTFTVDPADAKAAPQDRFHLGPLQWDVAALASAPALQPFRAEFNATCAGKRGMAAALCINDDMVAHFPFGNSTRDMFSHRFDPAADLAAHLGGEPGFCTTRSAIMVNELLSVGQPARVVQLLPTHSGNHTVAEVWDRTWGWVMVDPSFGGVLGIDGRPVSALAAVSTEEPIKLVAMGRVPYRSDYYDHTVLGGGTIVYPSPWLHLRFGRRFAHWPYHALLGRLGGSWLRHGGGQALVRDGILVSFFGALVLLGLAGLGATRRRLADIAAIDQGRSRRPRPAREVETRRASGAP